MPSEMVERVSKTLCQHFDCRVRAIVDGEHDGTCADPETCNWRSYRENARAAIAAMREPTPEMLAAALPMTGVDRAPHKARLAEKALFLLETRQVQPQVHRDGLVAALTLIGDWQAAIDAALSED